VTIYRQVYHLSAFIIWMAGKDEDDDEGQINFSVALSPKTTRTRNSKPKQ